MSKPQIVLTDIPPARFAIIQKNISNQLGTPLVGNKGDAEKYGVHIGWEYEPEGGQLTLTVLGKPFYVPEGTVEEKLREACQ